MTDDDAKAFVEEKLRKQQLTKPMSEAKMIRSVTMPGSEPLQITETFATEGEAGRWIKNESAAWLHQRAVTKRAE